MIGSRDFIPIEITKAMIVRAESRARGISFDTSKDPRQFGSEPGRTVFGYLGEELVLSRFPGSISDAYDFDMILYGQKIEVKSVSCKFEPFPHYLCAVNSCEDGVHRQEADLYVFVRILNDMSQGWILGYMPCREFFQKGRFVPKGEIAAKDICFTKANATVISIENLYPAIQLPIHKLITSKVI